MANLKKKKHAIKETKKTTQKKTSKKNQLSQFKKAR